MVIVLNSTPTFVHDNSSLFDKELKYHKAFIYKTITLSNTHLNMEASDPFNTVPDHLICPICMEVPKNKVFQCRAGHTLCEGCYSQLTICPQCRLPLFIGGQRPIRNLVMEKLLDELSLECSFKTFGCTKKVDRTRIHQHLETCCYNMAKFGPFVSACKNIGFEDCPFKMNRGNIVESIQHLETDHGAAIYDSDSLEIEFIGFSKFFGGTKPIILNQKQAGYAFVILVTPTPGLLTWSAFYLRYPMTSTRPMSKYQLECSLKRGQLTWSVPPVDLLTTGDPAYLANLNRLYMLGSQILQCTDKFSKSVFALVKVKKMGESYFGQSIVRESNKTSLVLTPFEMPNVSIETGSSAEWEGNGGDGNESRRNDNIKGDSIIAPVQFIGTIKKWKCSTCVAEFDPASPVPPCDCSVELWKI